ELKQEIKAVETNLRQEIKTVETELKQEIKAVETNLKQEIKVVDQKLDKNNSEIKQEFKNQTRWFIGIIATGVLVAASIIIKATLFFLDS
ncbi:MAG: hypothetical protein LRZ99_03585, partial [Desulfotomaculum sp.]|nr:hypothetical protein [Desulfotomaculum sp.]